MPEDVKIPGLGNVDKKYVIAGVGVGVLIAVVVYVRSKKSAQNASSAGTSSALVTDPAGNQCSALDPGSGYCPGSAEDAAYQQQYAAGSVGAYGGSSGYGYGGGLSSAGLVQDPAGNQCTAVNPATGYCPGTPQDLSAQGSVSGTTTGGTGSGTGAGAPTTNSEWLTDALAVLPGGANSSNQTALASVLGGLTVTTSQKNVFLEAVGIIGNPPQGYPQPIKTSDTSGHPGPGGGGGTPATISGLTAHGVTNGIAASWNKVTTATGYAYTVRDLATHEQVGPTRNTRNTSVTVTGLKKGTDYNFGVQALPGGIGANTHAVAG